MISQDETFKENTCETCYRADRGCKVTPRINTKDSAYCNWIPAPWFIEIKRLHGIIENHERIGELVYHEKFKITAAIRSMLFTGLAIINPESIKEYLLKKQ